MIVELGGRTSVWKGMGDVLDFGARTGADTGPLGSTCGGDAQSSQGRKKGLFKRTPTGYKPRTH
ncbi:hypothetical protein WI697_19320 [Tistrella mobilis]|jgi:hypothetical protein|uniref:hypothetical protein n=1 Tax=Tistrella TaxID=171436 RepID=UPI0025CE5381|nr:hypothetical protein [Tistrella sp.]